MNGRLLAIDPGLNSMGVAYWRTIKHDVPSNVFLIKAPRRLPLQKRALWIAQQLDRQLTMCRGVGCDFVSEYPTFFSGGERGWVKGDLQKLVFLVGVLVGHFDCADWTLATPTMWKGQWSKDLVIRKLQRRFGPGATQDWEKDMWDAVGIGLWKLGRF